MMYRDMYMWRFEHSERWNFELNFGCVNSPTLVQSRCKTFRTQWCTPWRVCWRTIWREWRATWRSRSTKLGRTTKLNCKRLHVHDKLIAVECSWMEKIIFSARNWKRKRSSKRVRLGWQRRKWPEQRFAHGLISNSISAHHADVMTTSLTLTN